MSQPKKVSTGTGCHSERRPPPGAGPAPQTATMRRCVVHLALLAVVGVGVGCGHVVGKIGLTGTSPFIFALCKMGFLWTFSRCGVILMADGIARPGTV